MSRMSPKDSQASCDTFLKKYTMYSPNFITSTLCQDMPQKLPGHTEVGQAECSYNASHSLSHHDTYLNQLKMELGSGRHSKFRTDKDNRRQLKGGNYEFLKYLLHSGGIEQNSKSRENIQSELLRINRAAAELAEELNRKRIFKKKHSTFSNGISGKSGECTICPDAGLNNLPTRDNGTSPTTSLRPAVSLICASNTCTFNVEEVSTIPKEHRQNKPDPAVFKHAIPQPCFSTVTGESPRKSTSILDISAVNLEENQSDNKTENYDKEAYGPDRDINNQKCFTRDEIRRTACIIKPACPHCFLVSEEFQSIESSDNAEHSAPAQQTVVINNNKGGHHVTECSNRVESSTYHGRAPANLATVPDLSASVAHDCHLAEIYNFVADKMLQHGLKYNLFETGGLHTTTQDCVENTDDLWKGEIPLDATRQRARKHHDNEQKPSVKHRAAGKLHRKHEDASRQMPESGHKNQYIILRDSVPEIMTDKKKIIVHPDLLLKSNHTKQRLNGQQQSQTNSPKWICTSRCSPKECTLPTSKNKYNAQICSESSQCSYLSTNGVNKGEETAKKREEIIQQKQMLNRGHHFVTVKTDNCVEKIMRQGVPRKTGQRSKRGWIYLEESSTQDSKSDHFLHHLKMLQHRNREASIRLTEAQSFTGEALLVGEDPRIDEWSEQQVPVKMSRRTTNQSPLSNYSRKCKFRQKSLSGTESPINYNPNILVKENGKYTRIREKSHKMSAEAELMKTPSKNYYVGRNILLPSPDYKFAGHKIHQERSQDHRKMTYLQGTPDVIRSKFAADVMDYSGINSADTHNVCNLKYCKFPEATLYQQQSKPRNEQAGVCKENDYLYQRSSRSHDGTALSDVYRNGVAKEMCSKLYPSDTSRRSIKDQYIDQKPKTMYIVRGTKPPIHYIESINTSLESIDSICEDNEYSPPRRRSRDNSYDTDEELYYTVHGRRRHHPTRSSGACPDLDTHTAWEQKSTSETKQDKINASVMRQSLNQALKSAKESIYAATIVAEALSLIAGAKQDSSAPVLLEEKDRIPAQNTTFHGSKSNCGDNEILQHVYLKTPTHLSEERATKYQEMQQALSNPTLQRSSDQRPQTTQTERLPQFQSRSHRGTQIPEASLTSHLRKVAKLSHYRNDVISCYTQTGPDVALPTNKQTTSRKSLLLTKLNTQELDRSPKRTNCLSPEDAIAESMPGHDLVKFSSNKAAQSPQISVEIIFSLSPEISHHDHLTYVAETPSGKKEYKPGEEKYFLTGQPILDRSKKLIPKQKITSDLTSSKEERTLTNSFCKTYSCSSKATTFTDSMSQKISMSSRLDSQGVDFGGDSPTFTRNNSRSPARRLPSGGTVKPRRKRRRTE